MPARFSPTVKPPLHTPFRTRRAEAAIFQGTGAASLAALVARSHVPWLDTAWLYRMPITIDNGLNAISALSYYQTSVTLTGAAYTSFAAHAKADGSDLRVTDSDGTTLLSFALEGIDTANSAVYLLVKVPAVAAAVSSTLYIYYGNAAATSVSSYASTVGPTTAIVGPTDVYTQSDMTGFNANPVAVLLKNQGGVNGGGAGLNGKILCFLMAGSVSNGNRTNSNLAVMSSTDGGVTWGSKSTLVAHDASNCAEPRSVVELADGTILLCYSTGTFAASSNGTAPFYVARSVNGGSSWTNLALAGTATNPVAVPWTMGTNVGEPYGRMIETTPGGDLYLALYGALATDPTWNAWLQKCPSGRDPVNGSNWVTQGTIAADSVDQWSEPSLIQTTDSNHFVAILRNDTVGDLYSCTSADSGATWTTPARLNLPGVLVQSVGAAVSPELLKLASGNYLLCWAIRYGNDYGSTAAAISTDGGATWLDRPPYATTTGNTITLWDGGYPTAVQNTDGTICVLAYRNTGTLSVDNVFRIIVTEDYVCNSANKYTGCESFDATWTSHGANASVSSTQAHNGTNSIKIDNTVATGGSGDYAIFQGWSTNTAKQTSKVAVSFWRYMATNTVNDGVRFLDSTMGFGTGVSRVQVSVFGNASNHLKWYNGTAYQDTGVVVPNGQWGKITVRMNMGPSSTTGEILYDDVTATTSLGQAASGLPPYSVQFMGASVGSTQNVIDYVDDVYTHQYTPNTPITSTSTEQTFSAPPTFTAPSSGAAALAALIGAGVSQFTAAGSGAASLVVLASAGTGGFLTTGAGTASLTALTALGAGTFTAPSSGAASLVTLTAAGVGGFLATGSGAASLVALVAAGSGTFTARGTGAASLVTLLAAGTGTFSGTNGGGDLQVYPDAFGSTVATTVDPFASTARLKGS